MTKKIITTPSEAADDAADVRAYDRAKQRLASGEAEMVPAEFVNRILDGENKIRVWREFRGMTARELAAKADISEDHLSQIEGGERDGVETIKRIAAALRLDVDDLV